MVVSSAKPGQDRKLLIDATRIYAGPNCPLPSARRRKEIYLALYPETRHGAIGNGREKVRQNGDSTTERFTADTAAAAGQSERAALSQFAEWAPVLESAVIFRSPEIVLLVPGTTVWPVPPGVFLFMAATEGVRGTVLTPDVLISAAPFLSAVPGEAVVD
jgi:hypothetical protein